MESMSALDAMAYNAFEGVFDNDYVKQEIEWYGVKEYEKDGLTLTTRKLQGRNDHYLHKAFEVGEIDIPTFRIDGQLWMSLTPMEIQSAAYALSMVEGAVATAGLGMGYFALKAAQSLDVERVDVYETEEKVIEFFNAHFSDREGFDKINIIHGDVRELMKDKQYDVVFMDPYQTMLPDEVISDMEQFTHENEIGTYLFWGYEFVVWAALQYEMELPWIGFLLREYFREFLDSDHRQGLAKVGWDLPDEEYVQIILELYENYTGTLA